MSAAIVRSVSVYELCSLFEFLVGMSAGKYFMTRRPGNLVECEVREWR